MRNSIKQLAIFASGQGSNAAKIIAYFKNHAYIKISLIVTNNQHSKVIELAQQNGIPFYITIKENFFSANSIVSILEYHGINFIVLAGFLWKIPSKLIHSYQNKIFNVHPALLPKFGGKGMYGRHVHQAVIMAKEKESGITIHYVNEELDKGDIIFQIKYDVEFNETPESLSLKVRELEHAHYSKIIEQCIIKLTR